MCFAHWGGADDEISEYLSEITAHMSSGSRTVNKLWVLLTLHIIISAFHHDFPYRNTFFPDSVMSNDELR